MPSGTALPRHTGVRIPRDFPAYSIQKIIETLSQQLQAKGKELNEFREKHNIRLMGEDEKPAAKENSEGAGAKSSSAGVLVS
ncbi:Prefoldin subunit 2 [Microtus ochrogaster]|uniref:Prefoldin subunit 2 n=1 Tax=Microtus ochrogaster TaxID=79684 RepID=A0A8J6G4N8_MICOH|nr:Prefoldin subunit 2 [Microtus ochrogaster]